MSKETLDRRRSDLIKLISEIDDEDLLISIEDQIFEYKEDKESSSVPPIPEILCFPAKAKLHQMIEQVLEDDRTGKMIDGEEFFKRFREKHNLRKRR
ncbi:hypothetical protein [Parabacteroides sp.]